MVSASEDRRDRLLIRVAGMARAPEREILKSSIARFAERVASSPK
jgi:hypothetical protein